MKNYKNFKEVDRDLKLLKLQMEIDKERTLLGVRKTKESLQPKSIFKSAMLGILYTPFVFKSANKVLGFIAKRF